MDACDIQELLLKLVRRFTLRSLLLMILMLREIFKKKIYQSTFDLLAVNYLIVHRNDKIEK